MNQKTLTAYHEAGHAVMALLMGRSVQKVSITPSQNRLGVCTMDKTQHLLSDKATWKAVKVIAAIPTTYKCGFWASRVPEYAHVESLE